MIPRIVLCVALLTLPLAAQGGGDRPAAQQAGTENVFFRAFYLNRGERRYEEALELYRKFLSEAPNSRYAARAARDAVAILSRSGKQDEAQELRKEYASLFGGTAAGSASGAAADTASGAADTPRGDSAARRGGDQPAGNQVDDARRQELSKQLDALKAERKKAVEAGDDAEIQRLDRRIARVERSLAGGGGDRGSRGQGERGGRGQGRRGRMQMKFAEMSDDEIADRLEMVEQFRGRQLERLREQGQSERADEMEKQWKEIKKLLKDGKKAEAQKIWDQMMTRRRR